MLNPLNSMMAQLANQERLIRELQRSTGLSSQAEALLSELEVSQQVTEQSSKLLDFNVENIVSLPKLKEKNLPKNFGFHSIREAVNEVVHITSWTASQRKIAVETSLPWENSATFDKRRFQQVLLNYLSNAIKFIDKEAGKVKIKVQISEGSMAARSSNAAIEKETLKFYCRDIFSESQKAKETPEPEETDGEAPKLILSVFDNGVGSEEKARANLFNLFSGFK